MRRERKPKRHRFTPRDNYVGPASHPHFDGEPGVIGIEHVDRAPTELSSRATAATADRSCVLGRRPRSPKPKRRHPGRRPRPPNGAVSDPQGSTERDLRRRPSTSSPTASRALCGERKRPRARRRTSPWVARMPPSSFDHRVHVRPAREGRKVGVDPLA